MEFIWSFIKPTLCKAMREFIPLKKQNAAYHPKYFTPSIRHQVNCVRSLKKKYHKSPTNANLTRLNNTKKLLANQISSAKSEYKSKLINDFAFNNQPKIYKYIILYEASRSLLQYQTQFTLVRLVLPRMSIKPFYLTNSSIQCFPPVISCQQMMMSL